MSAFARLSELGVLGIWPGVVARAVQGAQVTMAIVELTPHSVVARHQHPNEQVGIMLSGSMVFTVGDERRELVAGDTYAIPANVPHDVVAGPDGAVAIDVFAPVRDDWGRFEVQPPAPPKWP